MDDSASANPLIPIACRFIPYDQWLVTHVDTSWRIRDVKMWILSKCIPSLSTTSSTNTHSSRPATPIMPPPRHTRPRPSSPIVFAPDPHHRPMSPITFAQPVDPNRKDGSDDEDDELVGGGGGGSSSGMGILADEGRDGDGEAAYSYEGRDRGSGEDDGPVGGRIGGSKTFPTSQTSSSRSDSVKPQPYTPIHKPSPSYSSSAYTDSYDPTAPYAQYSIIRFSTGQLLEDDFALSMYDLRAYELLEIHRANVVVNLPRHILRDYILPYWEGSVKALRVVWRDDPSGGGGAGAGGAGGGGVGRNHHGDGRDGERDRHKEDPSKGGDKRKKQRKTKTRLEWRDRWIVIREGVLLVYKDRQSTDPSQSLFFSNLSSLHGVDHLKNVISTTPDQRIICAKFRAPPTPPSNHTINDGTSIATAESTLKPNENLAPPNMQYTTVTTISAGTPQKQSGSKRKLQIKGSFPSSSSLKSNGKPVSSKGLSESSSKSNLNNMFTMSAWKLDDGILRKSKKKQKKALKDKDKERADGDAAEDAQKSSSKDKGKGKAVAMPSSAESPLTGSFVADHGPTTSTTTTTSGPPASDAGQATNTSYNNNDEHDQDDQESVLSSPVFARTSGSEDVTDEESEFGRGGRAWRSKGGYGYRVGYRYVDGGGYGSGSRGGGGGGGDGDAANVSGDGTGPGTGVESGNGEDERDGGWNEGGIGVGVGAGEVLQETRTVDTHTHTRTTDTRDTRDTRSVIPDRGSVNLGRRTGMGMMESGRTGEWIVLDVGDDCAFNSLLRIFHRSFPDPIKSSFVSGLVSPTSATNTPLPSPSIPTAPSRRTSIKTNSNLEEHNSVHNPSMKSASSSADSLIGSTHHSHKTARSRAWRRDSVYSVTTSVQTNTFGALPYPEWRIDIAVKAQKAGMGDVGRAMGWMLWGRCLTDENDSMKGDIPSLRSSKRSRGSKNRRKQKQADAASLASRESKPGGSSSKKSVRSNSSTLTPTPSMKEPPDPYASDVSGGFSSDGSQFGLEGSDESDGYQSEAEWQGWMADLHRQARVRQIHMEAQRNQASTATVDVMLNFPLVSGGWYQSPYRNSITSAAEIPQTQAQALKMYQEGRRALEPTAVVVSTTSPFISSAPVPQAFSSYAQQPQPSSVAQSLSSPSSSESLGNSRRHRAMSFSPVEQPSSATPISAYSNTQYPLEADKLTLMGPIPAPPPFTIGTPGMSTFVASPTPKSLNFPPPLASATTGGMASSPPNDPSGPIPVRTPPYNVTSMQLPPVDTHPTQRRSSSAGLMTRSSPGSSENRGDGFSNGSPSKANTSPKGHRPRLSVTTTGNASAAQYSLTSSSPPATQSQSSSPLHYTQSPTRSSTARTFLHRMRSGSSMRSESKRHDDHHA